MSLIAVMQIMRGRNSSYERLFYALASAQPSCFQAS